MRPFLGVILAFLLIESSFSQVNPLSVVARVVTTSMDARSKAEVTADAEINAKLTAAKNIASVNLRWKSTGGTTVLMGIAQSKEEAAAALATVRRI